MIEYSRSTKPFDDAPLRPYEFTRRLIRNHFEDECEIFLVYGTPEGIGKSAYVSHVLADVKGYMKCKDPELLKPMWAKRDEMHGMPEWESDWESVKQYTYYPPDEVVDKCLYMLDHNIVDIAFHWDDAGKWLYAMEYNDPFVIAFMEYLPLARGNWKGGIILSTPFKDWILKRLLESEGVLRVRITKPRSGSDLRYVWKPRIARCFKKERYPGARRTYYPTQFEDHFIGIMHQPFYEWYWPQRRAYGKIAAVKMRMAIEKRRKKGWSTEEAEEILRMEKHILDANDKAVDFREAIAAQETVVASS